MAIDILTALPRWANFYVIIGSAAAALTGLQFVVLVLGAQIGRGSPAANEAFGTPTIVHFCTVLLISALMTAPWPGVWPLTLLLGACAIVGVLYAGITLRIARQQTTYHPVLEDWVCHFILPPLAYAFLFAAALLLQLRPVLALFICAGAALLLLFTGVHNAWDSVTFIALHRRPVPEQPQQEPSDRT